jgi:uncharacterized protein (TIGR03067 family)
MNFRAVLLCCAFALTAFGLAPADDKAAKELKKAEGVWLFESQVVDGEKVPADHLKGVTFTVTGNKFAVKRGDEVVHAGSFKVDFSKSPKAIDATITEGTGKGTVWLGIVALDGDTLKFCFDPQGKKRPTNFGSAPGSGLLFNVHKRVKKKEK